MCAGSTRNASARLAISTIDTVKGTSTIRSPKRPPIMASEANAITVVMDAANTGAAMRRAALADASAGAMPRRMLWAGEISRKRSFTRPWPYSPGPLS